MHDQYAYATNKSELPQYRHLENLRLLSMLSNDFLNAFQQARAVLVSVRLHNAITGDN